MKPLLQHKALYLQTLWRLGLGNVWAVAWYRLRLRFGIHPVQRVKRELEIGAFFRQVAKREQAAQNALHPPRRWRGTAVYFGWHREPLDNNEGLPHWHRNPFTGGQVEEPSFPWWKLSDFESGVGDIKIVWEPSRFDWVLAFAQQAVTGDKTAINRLNRWLRDWCRKNPCYRGPNWKCAQEASVRVMHLAVAAWLLDQQNESSPSLVTLIEAHLARIRPTLAYARAQDNNHGTSEAAALYIGGHWLARNGFAVGVTHAEIGQQYLEERVARLIAADGTFSQYSVNYHRLMLDTVSLVECWRSWLDLPAFSKPFYQSAEKAACWLFAMTDADTGDVPNIGANDGANLLPLTDADYRDYRPAVQLALALFAGKRAFNADGPHAEHLKWLGVEIPDWPEGSAAAPDSPATKFDDGGFVVLRSQPWRAVFRYPRYRFRPSHCDALHLDLWDQGVNVLRDGGSYSYNTEETWQRYFTGPAGHNCIEFDGRDPMPTLGRFLRGAWLDADSVNCYVNDAGWSTAQAAYTDWQGSRHLRLASLTQTGLIVRDTVSDFSEKAVLRWRLMPDEWTLIEDGVCSPRYILRITADVPIKRLDLVEGWESRYYLHKSPIPVLEVEVAGAGTLETRLTATASIH